MPSFIPKTPNDVSFSALRGRALRGQTCQFRGNSMNVLDGGKARTGFHWTELTSALFAVTAEYKAVFGTRPGAIASTAIAAGSANAVAVRDKKFTNVTIFGNDMVLGSGAAVVRSVQEATRALLSMLTADARVPADTAAWVFSAGWTGFASATLSMGAKMAQTSTTNAYAQVNFTGTQGIDLFFYADGVNTNATATISEGGTTLGTVNTAGVSVDDPTPVIFRVRGRGAGTHTINVVVNSGTLFLMGATVPSTAPRTGVVLGECPPDQARYPVPAGAREALWAAEQAVVAEFPSFSIADPDLSKWNPVTMTVDGLHPNEDGCAFIADQVGRAWAAVPYSLGNGNIVTEGATYPAAYTPPAAPATPGGGVTGAAL